MADLIILNGTVWTANKKHPRAEALAVKGDKIIAVGSSREIIKKKNNETTLIDGKRRSRYTYALKSLINNGVKLAFGTDWPVVPLNPLEGIQAAVTRQTKGGSHPQGWIPEEKISLEDALRAYTINGAYTEYSENVKGSIEPGKLADIAVLSKNVFEVPLREIAGIKVNMTIFDGKILYPS